MALYASENLTAKSVSKASGVAREIVYQIIPKLQKKGLVDELVTTPKTFKAVPLEDALAVLLEHRKQEDKELFAKAKEMAKKQQQNNSVIKNEDSNITIIAPKKGDPNWKRDWTTYQKSVDLIMPAHKFLQWPQYFAELTIEEAAKKNLKMHMVTDKETQSILENPPAKFFSPSLASKLKYIEYRFVDKVPVELVIFDKKIMYVSTQKEKQTKDMVWLRSNNGFLVEMANNYFESLWSNPVENLNSKTAQEQLPLLRKNYR
jgi:sugar-specific transcriptional regulator TrmB